MYLLLVILGGIVFIHSLLFVFIIQKNTKLMNKIEHIERRKVNSNTHTFKSETSKKEMQRSKKVSKERRTKLMKRGSRKQ